ncbi:hypothetical protein BGZ49_003911 [Haplosporangium sp. Z 27]|nr:hypothetical protein BGZ49_003911 [Haplosporangium sp. Z 27]
MEPPLPRPPSNETFQLSSSNAVPHRVGSLLLQAVPITVATFSSDLDLGSIANPQKYSIIKQYLFASLLFKPFLTLLLDCFSIVYLSSWVKDSFGKANSSGLILYIIATCLSLIIVCYGGWRAHQALKKNLIQAIFVNREAYRWICLTSSEKFLFFERIGQGYGIRDALVFFTWFTLRDWLQHLVCDLIRLVINCTILAAVAHQQSLKDKGEALTLVLPELSGFTHFVIAVNIMLQVCNLIQFLGAVVVLVLVRLGKLVSLRKDEHLHTYCQRNLNVRIVRMYKLAKSPQTRAPLTQNNHLEQRFRQSSDVEDGIDLSLAALAWDTETQDDHIDFDHYAYKPRPSGPPSRKQTFDDNERIEMSENPRQPDWIPSSASSATSTAQPVPGSFSWAQQQHLQLQRQKYGDDREKYEPMQWNPKSSNSSENNAQVQNQSSSQGYFVQTQGQQQQNQYQPPQNHYQPPSQNQYSLPPPPVGGQWTSQGGVPPTIPPKNF